ncbi:PLP-dependent aminotransferase family protein [Roseateles sp. DAIF2]|uniref:aminotransferase-like domain-containing protein n=1 Tax=Roseateles sp. DAIF2 TaxID=2714952 RepID=UPI0018A2FB2A|nr:PLP-dependent aminotransferase family protein [Roseateles sp. DAIF2]QPF72938.1 PLP-dependent aminotransferase family protein [Roseateles sp. DAIF2]
MSSSSPFRYRSLAETLAAALRVGQYPSGGRLPSVRQLCAAHGVSLATVTHALHELEDAGLIEARPRRGFFVSADVALPALAAAEPVEALALAGRRRRLMALAASQADCLSLGHLGLAAELLPLPALKRLMRQRLQGDLAALSTGSVFGGEALRGQLARRGARMGCRFDAEDIVVTQGEGESLQLCLSLLSAPGDRVAIGSPAPLRALELITSLGRRAVEIPADERGGLSLPALAAALEAQPIAVCIAEPGFDRSGGAAPDDAAKRALLALLNRHELPLIECELLGELYRGTRRPAPLKAFDTEDRVLYCGSLACVTGVGFSIGYVVSARHRLQLRAARAVHGELIPGLQERVLADLLADEAGFEAHLRRLRRRLARQLEEYRAAVLAAFPLGTRVTAGVSGHALWLELPQGLDACLLLERARRRGYNFVPGAVFGLGRQFDHCLRLTAGHPLDAPRAEGLRVLGELARQLLG